MSFDPNQPVQPQPSPAATPPAQTASVPQVNYPPADQVWEDARLVVLRQVDQQRYLFGVVFDGAFVWFASRGIGGVDDDLAEAKQPGFKQQRADTYRRERLGF